MAIQVIIGLGIILLGAELFTNSIEWLGQRMGLSEGAVGNLLAAVGTALPESLVPLVAFFRGTEDAMDIGIGAILGAPFMLGTLTMFVTGLSAWLFRKKKRVSHTLQVQPSQVLQDLMFFTAMYLFAISVALFPSWAKTPAAIVLMINYVIYAWHTLHSGQIVSEEGMRALYLSCSMQPAYVLIMLQMVFGVGAIVGGAEYFIHGISEVAQSCGIHPLVLSLVIAPIATELPEKFNSILWIAHGKDRLALGNITGAMVFQSTMIPALGILCSDWTMHLTTGISSTILLLTVFLLCFRIRKKNNVSYSSLIFCGSGYAIFLGVLLWGIL